jgi:asparagine synthase (glutamine-hydrolysing)
MSAIYGLFQRDSSPLKADRLVAMQQSLFPWEPSVCQVWQDGLAGLGFARRPSTPEGFRECMPNVVDGGELVFSAAARVDNRMELGQALGISPAEGGKMSDGEFVLRAYQKWGEDSPNRIFGDWAFAAWHPSERQLFLARDHYGNTALYYHANPHTFAFSSSRQALLTLGLAPVEMDELYLAQVLVSWFGYHGERSIHAAIRRLPPAHCLSVTPEHLETRCYWRLEETPDLILPKREDYVEAFRQVFDQAVSARLGSNGPLGVTLSGGLDSGSVTATAASFLRESGQRLSAFTSVPLFDPKPFVGQRFGDEFPCAQATARQAGNVDLHPVQAASASPVQAIRRMLEIHNEPGHGAGNSFWILDLMEAIRENGCQVLLTGQMGNAGLSWNGDILSQPWGYQLQQLGGRLWIKERLKRAIPVGVYTGWWRYKGKRLLRESQSLYRRSAINLDFARRLNLFELRLNDPNEATQFSPRLQRLQWIKPGRSFGGALWAETGAAFGLDVRDPTADARLLAFTLSVPDRIFIDPETGMDRWLVREAMKGRLPDDVRLNRSRGRQAGDLVPRLRQHAGEVERALKELQNGPAAAYVDVPYMRQIWQMVQTQDTKEAFVKAATVLCRGIMAGLFVNQL